MFSMMRHRVLARGAGKVSGRRTGGPGCSVVLILKMLAGCAARPGPEALDPVAQRPEGNGSVTVPTVTNRALTGGKPRLGLARADDPQIQEIARQNGVRILDVSNLPATDGMKHDRFIVLAARYSAAAAKDCSGGGVRQAGVYILDATGRILSAPFAGTARILAGSP